MIFATRSSRGCGNGAIEWETTTLIKCVSTDIPTSLNPTMYMFKIEPHVAWNDQTTNFDTLIKSNI